jgi:lipoic acid synthetase
MKFPILEAQPASGRPSVPTQRPPKPPWLKVQAPGGARYERMRERIGRLSLHTVCEEAHCPNLGECWNGGTATIMLMGGVCTRGCRFCAVTSGRPPSLDPEEPLQAAQAVVEMGVDYIVITSVNRDDLPDGGSAHFARTVREIDRLAPQILVEVLIPDFEGRLADVDRLIEAGPEVIAHNLETVRRLTRGVRDPRANFDQSLSVLGRVAEAGRGRGRRGADILAKTSLMLGLGETRDEVLDALRELRGVGCAVVTFGQYLQPSPKHLPVFAFVAPEVFNDYAEVARGMGFVYVASGPLVRSSYRAGEYYLRRYLAGEASA